MNLHAESDYFSPLTQKYLMRGKEDKGARFFSVVPSGRTTGNRQKLKYITFHLNTQKNFLLLG